MNIQIKEIESSKLEVSYTADNNDNFIKYMNKELIIEIELLATKYNITIIKDENEQFTKEFIEKFQNEINWDIVSYNEELSEEFIREFQSKVNWEDISYNQKLSEIFIEEFQDKLNWNYISEYQKLSENFIRKYLDKLDVEEILEHQKLNDDFRNFLRDKIHKTEGYILALAKIQDLWDKAEIGTLEGENFKVLSILIDAYEQEHFPIPPPDPVKI
jgi:hypothetical protein